jgi:hypothetical protein
MKTPKYYLQISLLLAASALPAQAGTFFNNFDSGALPPGTHTNSNSGSGGSGGAYLETVDGVGNSGCLKITKTVNSQNGSFILDDLDAGNPIYGFDINFNVRIGGSGNPADGFAVVVAPDIGDTSLWGETGAGSGFRFTWGTYTGSGQTPPDPAIRVRVGPGGNIVAYKGYTVAGMSTGGTDPSTWWSNAHIHLSPDGSLTFDFKGANVFSNYFIPGYQDLVNAGVPVRFGISGRTGGLNDNFWIDNLSITTFTNSMVGVSQQPRSSKVLSGDDAIFDVAVGNVNGVTYQWLSNGVPISGATAPTLIMPAVTGGASGSAIAAVCTGPNNVVTSSVATLTVVNLTLPTTPQLSYNFDDTNVPPGTAIFGTAFVDFSGGVGNSPTLKLTEAGNNQWGAFVISDPDAGAPVYGFTLRAKMLVGGGTTPPADGFAIAFGNDIPADPTATVPQFEEGQGLGSGLIVTFDIYNNGGYLGYAGGEAQPAPSIDVRFGGALVASVPLPLSFIESGARLDDAIVQLNNDGTINVVYRGSLIFDHLVVPGFTSISGGSFAIAGRTGGLNENIWVDNVELTTVTSSGAVRIVGQSGNQTVLVNHAATNSITVNDPTGVTYQWYRGASQVSGATDSSYVLPSAALTDSGATFTAVATKSSVSVTGAPVTLTVVNLTAPPTPVVTYNFDDGLVPAGTTSYGNTYVTPNGGVGDSGTLHIVDNANSAAGAWIVQPLLGGAQISALWVAFDVRLGGGTIPPADGLSFNFAPNLTEGTIGGAEDGTGGILTIGFDIYDNGNENPPAPSIDVRYKGALVASTHLTFQQIENGGGFQTVLLRVDQNGKLDLAMGERVLATGLQLPNYTFVANAKYGFYGRTGGLNENEWLDNVRLQPTQSTGPMTIVQQPANATVVAGNTATFNVAISAPVGATYQWQKNGVNISGATTSAYTTPATTLSDNGAAFRVTATGASGSATSSNAVLTVVAPITITSPGIVYDFNDGAVPAGASLAGNAYIDGSGGGVTNSGVLHLTDALNGEGGSFVIADFNSNAPVKALTVYFAMHAYEGTAPPADGWSFVWCSSNDLPTGLVFGEDGTGNGLIVGFDVFDNGNETPPAPSIDLHYKGAFIATVQLPYQQVQSGPGFADTYIRVDANGFCDVQYNGMVIFNHIKLPNYTAMSGNEFAWGARTGGLNENQWIDNIEIATTLGLVPVPLSFTTSGANLRLTWDNSAGFKLQSATTLAPPNWTDVPGASSPYLAPLTGPAQFFRLAPAP